MAFKFWPFNKSKKEEELKRKKKKIIIWCFSIGSIAVLAGGGVGLYFVLKPKSSGGGGGGDGWFPEGAIKLIDVNNTNLNDKYFVCPNPIWTASENKTFDFEKTFLEDGTYRAVTGYMRFHRENWAFSGSDGKESIVVYSSLGTELLLGWEIRGGVAVVNSSPFSTGSINNNQVYYVKLDSRYWSHQKYNDITGETGNQSFDEWLQKCYFTSNKPT